MRLMSEVPLGVFLSGGIDSSAVAAAVRKTSQGKVTTFSVGYEEDFGTNEFEYAGMVANALGTDHHECRVSIQDFHELVPRLVWHLDEPLSDPAAVPLYFLSRLSREHVTVVLSGEGADEILGGYSIYKKMLAMENFRRLPPWFRGLALSALSKVAGRREKWAKYIFRARLPLEQRYRGVSGAFMPASIEKLCRSGNGAKESLDEFYASLFGRMKGMDSLNRMLYVDMKTWLPDDLLLKADKMTMAASQELRVPFLDHKLVEFAFSLPPADKICKGTTKSLLKRSVKDLIPSAVVQREKKGFPVPIEQWFRGDLYGISRDLLLSSSSSCRDRFDISYVASLLERHRRGEEDLSGAIWNLLVFEYWCRIFMQAPAETGPVSAPGPHLGERSHVSGR
jgi:asparagine synthase (glutamine-hydrolysing)